MAHSYPEVTAVMPARNDAAGLSAAAQSVLAQDYPGDLTLVIAVGPSDDDTEATAQLLAVDERVTVTPNPAGGTGAGLNAALELAHSPIAVRVDAHCELPQGYVLRAVETMQRTGAGNVGGIQRARGSTPFQRAVATAMTSRFGVGNANFHYGGNEGPTDTVYLGVFDREAIREVGEFDESLTRNQDYELNWRLREAGHTVWFDPELAVDYSPRSTRRALAKQYFEYGQWKREVLRRHPRSLRLRQLVPPLTLLGVVSGLAGALGGRRKALALPLIYGAAIIVASAIEARDPSEASILTRVFPTMHMAWGAGFLVGPGLTDKARNRSRERQH